MQKEGELDGNKEKVERKSGKGRLVCFKIVCFKAVADIFNS